MNSCYFAIIASLFMRISSDCYIWSFFLFSPTRVAPSGPCFFSLVIACSSGDSKSFLLSPSKRDLACHNSSSDPQSCPPASCSAETDSTVNHLCLPVAPLRFGAVLWKDDCWWVSEKQEDWALKLMHGRQRCHPVWESQSVLECQIYEMSYLIHFYISVFSCSIVTFCSAWHGEVLTRFQFLRIPYNPRLLSVPRPSTNSSSSIAVSQWAVTFDDTCFVVYFWLFCDSSWLKEWSKRETTDDGNERRRTLD